MGLFAADDSLNTTRLFHEWANPIILFRKMMDLSEIIYFHIKKSICLLLPFLTICQYHLQNSTMQGVIFHDELSYFRVELFLSCNDCEEKTRVGFYKWLGCLFPICYGTMRSRERRVDPVPTTNVNEGYGIFCVDLCGVPEKISIIREMLSILLLRNTVSKQKLTLFGIISSNLSCHTCIVKNKLILFVNVAFSQLLIVLL